MIQALIFDYFGVIRPQGNGLRSIYRSLGGDTIKDEAFIADVTSAGGYGFISDMDEQLAARLGTSVEQWRAAVARAGNNDPVLLAYILKLRKQGFRIGLLSNAGPGSLEVFFQSDDSNRYFDAALVSGDTGLAKPQAAFYELIAQKLGVSAESCVMIDDRPIFCEGAVYVGMKSIVYSNYDQFVRDLAPLISR